MACAGGSSADGGGARHGDHFGSLQVELVSPDAARCATARWPLVVMMAIPALLSLHESAAGHLRRLFGRPAPAES